MLTTNLIILCLKIFFCRIIDVSLSTFRTVIIVRGKTKVAAIIAIVEALVWFLVVREALNFETVNKLETLNIALAYALGFSAGNIIGGELSKKISGTINVQVVTSKRDPEMIKMIQDKGFKVTVSNGEPSQFSGEKYLIFAVIENSRLREFKELIMSQDDKAFMMASETKVVTHAVVK
jgi:uncharacterized protein YebE (UPF0316 family)